MSQPALSAEPSTQPVTADATNATKRLWPALLALFLLVLGARFWLIWNYGSAMPYWDQWPGEGLLVLKPWKEGNLTWAAMFAPHLEHRIFFTRALVLGLFQINGQWDVQLETACNAILCSGLIAAIAATLLRTLPTHWAWRTGILLGLGLLFSLPFGWENTLGGFQSQFYFLLGFSLLALWGLGLARPFSVAWWLGAVAAVAACFSMGSGLFAAAIVLGWMLLGGLKDRRWSIGLLATALVCAGVMVLGWALRNEVPGHAVLKAGSPGAWFVECCRCLAWPYVSQPAWVIVMVLPLTLLAAGYFFRSNSANLPQKTAVGLTLLLGGWVVLQAAAMAYARGGPKIIPSRYLDLLATGVFANGVAAGLLISQTAGSRTWRRFAAWLTAGIWLTVCAVGLTRLTLDDFKTQLPEKLATLRIEEAHVRAYVLTNDLKTLPEQPPLAIPYPIAEHLASYLNDATLRAALPAVVRAPLRLEPDATAAAMDHGFSAHGLPPKMRETAPEDPPMWGSYGEHGAADEGGLHARLQPPAQLPYLEWQFAGDLDGNDAALALRIGAAGNGAALHAFHPSRIAGEHWRTEFLPAPATDLGLEAEDKTTTGWFAFRAPVEVGRWSYWAGWMLRRGAWIFFIGAIGLILALIPLPAPPAWLKLSS